MSANPQFVNLGQQLKERRESLGLSLKQVFEKTKISVSILKAIEEGQYNQFPVYAYLRGFILSYTQVLEMDSVVLLKELEATRLQSEKKILLEEVKSKSSANDLNGKTFHLTPVILASGCLLILFCSLIFYSWFQQDNENINVNYSNSFFSNNGKMAKAEEGVVSDNTVNEEVSVLAPGLLEDDKELEVIVKALKEVTFSYSVDKEPVRKMSLRRDQFEVFKGKERIWVKTDKSERIRIFQNGNDKGVFGPSGEKEQEFFIDTSKPFSFNDDDKNGKE